MNYVKICPKCGSTNIKMPNAGLDIKMTVRDRCQDCGFIGNFPEVEEDKVEDFRQNIQK